jgi:6-pyruvoyltetrahydropterin/6-carboxytetrahydropterin synthase
VTTNRCTRRVEFDAGHRVLRHESKCRHIHGHRYVCEITVDAPDLDALGRVIDFGCLKTTIGGWVDQRWDHNLLLHPDDPLAKFDSQANIEYMFGGKAPFVMPNGNPTAENIAQVLYAVSAGLLRDVDEKLLVTAVRVYETPNCWADCLRHPTGPWVSSFLESLSLAGVPDIRQEAVYIPEEGDDDPPAPERVLSRAEVNAIKRDVRSAIKEAEGLYVRDRADHIIVGDREGNVGAVCYWPTSYEESWWVSFTFHKVEIRNTPLGREVCDRLIALGYHDEDGPVTKRPVSGHQSDAALTE